MSEIEDSATTVARLLRTKMRVTRDDGALAQVNVSGEWQNSDALKGCDGQVTVGLAECADQKVELSGKLRRRLSFIKINVWTTDSQSVNESGKTIRGKIVEATNLVIRQNRINPNDTLYDFVGSGPSGQSCKAYTGVFETSPNVGWSELSDIQYQQLWYSDDSRCQVSCGGSGEFAVLLFGFKVESRKNAVKKIVLAFEGYGTSPGGSGVTVKAWNNAAGEWQNPQTSQGVGDEVLALAFLSDLPSYIDESGYVWFLAKTTYPSDGVSPATLSCDYVSCAVTVNGITYCDVVGYRNLDRVDVKPFVYRTEFTLKSWFIENIGV